MITLAGDFETRSTQDLKEVGLYNYATHPDTSPWCFAYAIDDGPVQLWTPDNGHSLDAVNNHIRSGGIFRAYNVTFEWHVWNYIMVPRYGCTPLDIAQCRCTMAAAYAMALPGKLEHVAPALGLNLVKDMAGHKLMLKMAVPNTAKPESVCIPKCKKKLCVERGYHSTTVYIDDGHPRWHDSAENKTKLYEYCKTDVEVERQVSKRIRPLSDFEQRVWLLDQKINHRGVAVDTDAARRAVAAIGIAQADLNNELARVTAGAVTSASFVAQLTEWIDRQSVPCKSLDKESLSAFLAPEFFMPLPANVRRALEIRQTYAKSSTAKFGKMLDVAGSDSRLRGMFQYHGAATGRWAARAVQLHNLPRPILKAKQIEHIIDNHIDDLDYLGLIDHPLDIYPSLLRGMLRAPEGQMLHAVDYANIEGRVLAWIAGEAWKLDAFREFDAGTGPDLYKLSYSRAFGIVVDAVTKDQRQIGKTMELALGFQGGVGAFQQMASGYGVRVSDERADELKTAWRAAHPATQSLWCAVERAAISAARSAGEIFSVSKLKFVRRGSFLWCRLPSGRYLCYPYPQVVQKQTPWGEMRDALEYKCIDPLTKKWGITDTYGGSLVENAVQAIARDILADAMLRLDDSGFVLVLHVHDEAVAEGGSREDMENIMIELPPWALGLPIAVEGWTAKRYRK